MKVKSTKYYEVCFDDKELVEALVHWITNVRCSQDMIDIGTLIHNSDSKVVRKCKKTFLRFELNDDELEF